MGISVDRQDASPDRVPATGAEPTASGGHGARQLWARARGIWRRPRAFSLLAYRIRRWRARPRNAPYRPRGLSTLAYRMRRWRSRARGAFRRPRAPSLLAYRMHRGRLRVRGALRHPPVLAALGSWMRRSRARVGGALRRPRALATFAAGTLAFVFIGLVTYLTAVLGASGGLPIPEAVPQDRPGVIPSPTSAAGPNQATASPSLPGVNVHVNDRAGYLFSYPNSWALAPSGQDAMLVSPNGDVVVSFGLAPIGSLERASDGVVASLTNGYGDVELVAGGVERTEQGERSLVVGGTATDANGDLIRFLAITIQGSDQNRAITVHFSADSDPVAVLPSIREIVASYRTSEIA